MPSYPIPPPGQRFRWIRWEPYPNRQFVHPDDPPAGAEAYLLKMGGYEIARIQRLHDGRWLGVVGTLWHRGLWLSHAFDDKAAAIARIERWANREIEGLLISRPMAFAEIPISHASS
jgi:hypothetical protein